MFLPIPPYTLVLACSLCLVLAQAIPVTTTTPSSSTITASSASSMDNTLASSDPSSSSGTISSQGHTISLAGSTAQTSMTDVSVTTTMRLGGISSPTATAGKAGTDQNEDDDDDPNHNPKSYENPEETTANESTRPTSSSPSSSPTSKQTSTTQPVQPVQSRSDSPDLSTLSSSLSTSPSPSPSSSASTRNAWVPTMPPVPSAGGPLAIQTRTQTRGAQVTSVSSGSSGAPLSTGGRALGGTETGGQGTGGRVTGMVLVPVTPPSNPNSSPSSSPNPSTDKPQPIDPSDYPAQAQQAQSSSPQEWTGLIARSFPASCQDECRALQVGYGGCLNATGTGTGTGTGQAEQAEEGDRCFCSIVPAAQECTECTSGLSGVLAFDRLVRYCSAGNYLGVVLRGTKSLVVTDVLPTNTSTLLGPTGTASSSLVGVGKGRKEDDPQGDLIDELNHCNATGDYVVDHDAWKECTQDLLQANQTSVPVPTTSNGTEQSTTCAIAQTHPCYSFWCRQDYTSLTCPGGVPSSASRRGSGGGVWSGLVMGLVAGLVGWVC